MSKIILIAFIFTSLSVGAQMIESEVKTMIENANEEKLVGESSRFLQENFFHFANMVTDKLLKYNNKNGNYNYRKGYILLEMNMDPEQALNHLLIASKDVKVNYDIYSPSEKSAPIDVYYHMGICYHRLGNLDKALEYYQKFIAESNKQSNLIAPAKIRVAQVANAKKVLQNPMFPAPVAMGGEVNTSYDELNPMISGDGKSLLVSSTRNRKDNLSKNSVEPMFNELPADIYQQTKNNQNEWSSLELFLMNDPKIDERLASLSMDERKLTYSSWNVSAFSSSEFVDGQFNAPKTIKVAVDNGKSKVDPFNMHFNVSADGKTAYFVSNAIPVKVDGIFLCQKTLMETGLPAKTFLWSIPFPMKLHLMFLWMVKPCTSQVIQQKASVVLTFLNPIRTKTECGQNLKTLVIQPTPFQMTSHSA
ncbi:MAG: tetratricopeptide repeat protein [Flavobacteriia bacterium]|nr:tetratricopeptide repeat protein [Flavobacteriia bacterium]